MRATVAILLVNLSVSSGASEWTSLREKAARSFESQALDQAECLLREALDIARSTPDHEDDLLSLKELGVVYATHGKFVEAKRLFAEALPLEEQISGPDNTGLVLTLNYLGVAERELQHFKA